MHFIAENMCTNVLMHLSRFYDSCRHFALLRGLCLETNTVHISINIEHVLSGFLTLGRNVWHSEGTTVLDTSSLRPVALF